MVKHNEKTAEAVDQHIATVLEGKRTRPAQDVIGSKKQARREGWTINVMRGNFSPRPEHDAYVHQVAVPRIPHQKIDEHTAAYIAAVDRLKDEKELTQATFDLQALCRRMDAYPTDAKVTEDGEPSENGKRPFTSVVKAITPYVTGKGVRNRWVTTALDLSKDVGNSDSVWGEEQLVKIRQWLHTNIPLTHPNFSHIQRAYEGLVTRPVDRAFTDWIVESLTAGSGDDEAGHAVRYLGPYPAMLKLVFEYIFQHDFCEPCHQIVALDGVYHQQCSGTLKWPARCVRVVCSEHSNTPDDNEECGCKIPGCEACRRYRCPCASTSQCDICARFSHARFENTHKCIVCYTLRPRCEVKECGVCDHLVCAETCFDGNADECVSCAEFVSCSICANITEREEARTGHSYIFECPACREDRAEKSPASPPSSSSAASP